MCVCVIIVWCGSRYKVEFNENKCYRTKLEGVGVIEVASGLEGTPGHTQDRREAAGYKGLTTFSQGSTQT